MLPLLETVIAFAVIMLILSFLVKSLSSVLKNYFDYYTAHMEEELKQLVETFAERRWNVLAGEHSALSRIDFRKLGEEYLTLENVGGLLKQVGVSFDAEALKARVELHKANVRYLFEKKMKNLSLVAGVALCLVMNINALTIWDTLYHDQGVRTKFASPQYVESVLKEHDDVQKKLKEEAPPQVKQDLERRREALAKDIAHFRGEVNFGVGRIWTERDGSPRFLLYEFFGSLLTGILASIGAPYWHDLLRAVAQFRKP